TFLMIASQWYLQTAQYFRQQCLLHVHPILSLVKNY
ncbi:unnamed protein product, partial [marine sediment metagenome]